MASGGAFDRWPEDYDRWYERFPYVYQSELNLIQRLLPPEGIGLEVGVGSGRFAAPLGIKLGLDPARGMLQLARRRGVVVVQGEAEHLPFLNSRFDFLLAVTTLCFLSDVALFFREAKRVLKKGGVLVLGFIDRESSLGKSYLARQQESRFFREAKLFTPSEVAALLSESGWSSPEFFQTLFGPLENLQQVEEIKSGWGEGSFIALRVSKE